MVYVVTYIGVWYFSRILAMPADADLGGPRTAARNAHGVFGVAVAVVLVQIALLEWTARFRGRHDDPQTVLELLALGPLQAVHVAQLLLMALLLGALTQGASRIFYCRRGH